MGFASAVLGAPRVAVALAAVVRLAARQRPRAALLVGWSEPNALLGRALRHLGVPVLWYAPPQVWAWRPSRAGRLAACADRFAVVLPFEVALWRASGAWAEHVGHPAHDTRLEPRRALRERLGVSAAADAIAVLPGSRPHEVRRLLPALLAAAAELRHRRSGAEARVLLTSALGTRALAWAQARARAAALPVVVDGSPAMLPAFDVALAASGTVTAECVVAGVPPVVAWRGDSISYGVARRALRTRWIGLPNIALQAGAFPELVQDAATPSALADAALELLHDRARSDALCREAARRLGAPDATRPAERVAAMLARELGEASRPPRRPSAPAPSPVGPW